MRLTFRFREKTFPNLIFVSKVSFHARFLYIMIQTPLLVVSGLINVFVSGVSCFVVCRVSFGNLWSFAVPLLFFRKPLKLFFRRPLGSCFARRPKAPMTAQRGPRGPLLKHIHGISRREACTQRTHVACLVFFGSLWSFWKFTFPL